MLVDRLYTALSRYEIAGADGEAVQLRLEIEAAAEERQALLKDASSEDRTFKLDFDTTSKYGRYVKSLWDPVTGRS